jgi:hypothetical protein
MKKKKSREYYAEHMKIKNKEDNLKIKYVLKCWREGELRRASFTPIEMCRYIDMCFPVDWIELGPVHPGRRCKRVPIAVWELMRDLFWKMCDTGDIVALRSSSKRRPRYRLKEVQNVKPAYTL